jgi:hypothetical protein
MNTATDTRRTMGELTVVELLASADNELSGLSRALDVTSMDPDDALLLKAYVGSIWARIANARMKLGD